MGNWEQKSMTTEELKKLVTDVYDQKIFTSFQCVGSNTMMVFMPMMFISAAPTEPSKSENNQINRKNKLKYIEDKLRYEEETPEREAYIKNIGMLYEYYSEAGPRGVNGYPIFYSCKIVTIEDTKKFIDMYNKYIEMRKEFEKEWGTNETV
jgi:hypothetical protein